MTVAEELWEVPIFVPGRPREAKPFTRYSFVERGLRSSSSDGTKRGPSEEHLVGSLYKRSLMSRTSQHCLLPYNCTREGGVGVIRGARQGGGGGSGRRKYVKFGRPRRVSYEDEGVWWGSGFDLKSVSSLPFLGWFHGRSRVL